MTKDSAYPSKEKFIKKVLIAILNIYAPNIRAPKSVKERLLQLKSHIDPYTLITLKTKTQPSSLDR